MLVDGDSLKETYQYVYEDFRENKPYPITLDEALEIMRAIDDIKVNSKIIVY